MHRLTTIGLFSLLTLALAAAAFAASHTRIKGTTDDDTLTGTPSADLIRAFAGNDSVDALARDNEVDTIDCGPGNDTVWLNAAEKNDVYTNCETVKTVTISSAQANAQDNG